jgi:hypothetical protein
MESTFFGLLASLVKGGKEAAPWAISAIFAVLYYLERKRTITLSDKLYELGMTIVKASTEARATLKAVEKGVDELRYRGRRDQ